MRRLARVALLGLPALFLLAAAPPRFDVASVRPSGPDDKAYGIVVQPGGELRAGHVTLFQLIGWAYALPKPALEIESAPGWAKSDEFTIEAKPPAPVTDTEPGQPGREQIRLMTQALLADRFQLAVNIETRQLPVYLLEVAPGGVKTQTLPDGPRGPGAGTMITSLGPQNGELRANAVSITVLVTSLSSTLDRPVVDQTGLTGTYSFDLHWTPPTLDHAVAPTPLGWPVELTAPLFDALPRQAGLRLRAGTGPVTVVVVTHAEKPTPN